MDENIFERLKRSIIKNVKGIMSRIFKMFDSQPKIDNVNTRIVKSVISSINKDENLAEKSKSEIIAIQKKAASEIVEILKQGDITEIHKEIESEWKNI